MIEILCKNPLHKDGSKVMKVLEETDERLLLGCEVCLANKIWSVQVRTRPKAWARARWQNELRGVERMKKLYRIPKITYSKQ